MRILIVDDESISLELLQNSLVSTGFEIDLAHGGEEALDRLQRERYQVVITDWNMPGMGGPELCQQIRRLPRGGQIYIIMLTMRDTTEDIVEGLSAGADDYISKPFNPAELLVRIRVGQRLLSVQPRDVTIYALAKLAESRDPETGAHLDRVRSMTRLVSQHLLDVGAFADEIDEEFVQLIYDTSPLHDIGKVGIPDHILLKPGRLTDQEFAIMKTHTTIGANCLEAAAKEFPNVRFLTMACEIARSHHECIDGSGYPDGLAGGDIPLSARIMAIADVYDALTSRRVYKEAFTHELACRIIQEDCGTQFDPVVVEAFMANQHEIAEIRGAVRDHDTKPGIAPALLEVVHES